jgi:hypothetical protein
MTFTLAGVLIPLLMGCGSVEQSRGLLGSGSQLVRVNEICAVNDRFEDPDSRSIVGKPEYDDWIELYNASEHDAHLAGYFITDNKNRPFKQVLPPEAVVPAHGFLVLFADNQPGEGPLHLAFALSGVGGESVYLADPRGNLLDGTDLPATPGGDAGDPPDHSYARFPDGSGAFQWCGAFGMTPGESNGSACADPP